MDSLFFKYIDAEPVSSSKNGLVTLQENELSEFSIKGQTNRRFNFQEGSLALKALKEGVVDFHDPKVNFSAQKVDLKQKDLLEVDLGQMTSLEQGKVHVDEENSQLREGQQLTDED